MCALFSADQKVHYLSLISYVFQICASLLEIVFLILTGNIYIYLIIQLASMILQQTFFGHLARKHYPYVCTKTAATLTKEEKRDIFGNVKAMFEHRIGATILSSTDNIIISKFVNITTVAVNDAYSGILAVVTQIFTQIFNLLASVIGFSNASSSRKESQNKFFQLHFINFWFYTFCSCALLLLLEPAISILFGSSYVFAPDIEFLLVLNFYIVGIRQITLLFKESMGLLRQDRFVPLIEATINLFISLIGVHFFGTAGVFAGTTVSMVLTSLPIEPYVLFRYGFHTSVSTFWETSIPYYVISVLLLILSHKLCYICVFSNIWLTFAVRLVLALLLPNLVILLFYHRSPEMKNALQTIKQILPNRQK